jgi:lipoprotein-anchoring transpeptidase ErfK/SrfK
MSGTNPDGSHYSDPGVPWVNYFSAGSAVHGFPRSSYGFPQSVGCLELPIPTAKTVFGLISYGTLVNVAGPHEVQTQGTPAPPKNG